VAGKGLKVSGFSMGCEKPVRVVEKGLRERQLEVDPSTTLRARSLKLKGEKREEAKADPSLRSG
jgi:hypothetical protein